MIQVKDNNILWVNLTTGKITKEEVPALFRKKFIGGNGINLKLLFDSGAMFESPFSEKNPFIVGVGPAVGTGLLAGNKCTLTSKSTITGLYGDSSSGGDFALNMKAVHIDHIYVDGKSEKPCILYIDKNGNPEIRDASEAWGKNAVEVVDYFESLYGNKIEVLSIGRAGESLVRFASVTVSRWHAAGRTGMGCVMGSKKIKAIVIETKRPIEINYYDKNKIRKLNKRWFAIAKKSFMTKNENVEGSLFLIKKYNDLNCLPVRNCQKGYEEKAKAIYSAPFNLKYVTKKIACYSCIAKCGREFEIKEGPFKGEKEKILTMEQLYL